VIGVTRGLVLFDHVSVFIVDRLTVSPFGLGLAAPPTTAPTSTDGHLSNVTRL
jgi:hypothetical protein